MSNATVPNPDTPFAFLPPDVAFQHEASQYLHVATLSAFIWDVLLYAEEDFILFLEISRKTVSLAGVTYFLSRFCTLLYLVVTTISEVSSIRNCNEILVAVGCTLVATSATTSLLFFIRVRAIFTGQRLVVGFFFILWLANLGSAIAVPFLISDVHIGPTERCTGHSVNPWTAATLVITGINDTLVMLTVSYVLIDGMLLSPPCLSNGVTSFFTGKDLPQVARALLQGGQLYYFITVGMNILTVTLKLIPSVPPIYRAMFAAPNFALENSMACRVYRNLKFGFRRRDFSSTVTVMKWSSTPAENELPEIGCSGNNFEPMSFREYVGSRDSGSLSHYPKP